jgi:L-seryl-tRNA(Ser) seleniumtransferase
MNSKTMNPCRPMKVGKEEIIGCLTALRPAELDEKKIYSEWNGRAERIESWWTLAGVKTDIGEPGRRKPLPTLELPGTRQPGFHHDCVRKLRETIPLSRCLAHNPSLVTAVREGNPNSKEHKEADHIELVSMTIQPGQEIIVGQTLRAVLSAAQKGKPA